MDTANFQPTISKENSNGKLRTAKPYSLDQRTLQFAREVFAFVKTVTLDVPCKAVATQLVRSSGSIGANYIEANDSLGKKDFVMRLRICRKEAKECRYWLQLMNLPENLLKPREELIQEATELVKIFSAIIRKAI